MMGSLRYLFNSWLVIVWCLCGLLFTNAELAASASYTLTAINTHQSISCDRLRLDTDSFKCKRGDVTYKYKAEAIETVTYQGEVIYPYNKSVTITEADLHDKDCDFLIENLRCPLLLEANADIFIVVGTMYEQGICTKKNTQKAYYYYRRAGKQGMKKYAALRKKMN